MFELPVSWIPVLNTLIEAPVAWQTPAQIALALGQGDQETTDLLCDLDVAGWLDVWDAEDGPRITLSALGAERLAARVVEVGVNQTPRWARTGDPEPRLERPKNVCYSARAASMEFLADPAIPHDLAAELADLPSSSIASERAGTASKTDPPRPTVLLGLGLSPWPGPSSTIGSVCPACGGETLYSHMYCLYCDRWGLDQQDDSNPKFSGPAFPKEKRRSSAAIAAQEEADRLECERLRTLRKQKRQLRARSQIESERRRKEASRNVKSHPEVSYARPPLKSTYGTKWISADSPEFLNG